MDKDLKSLGNSIDALIRNGQGADARQTLAKIIKETVIPREFADRFAELARRLNEPMTGLRLLRPYVRPSDRKKVEATDSEKSEYAGSLIRLGAFSEAKGILATVSTKFAPALLFRAFAEMGTWNYKDCLDPLNKYLTAPGITDYQILIGKVNLSSALIYEGHFAEARKVLEDVLEATEKVKAWLLHGNALELSAACSVYEGSPQDADFYLRRAEDILKSQQSFDFFLMEKWRAISKLLLEKGSPASLTALAYVRQKALERRHYETVRDCDRFKAVTCKSKSLATYLYFGTPFESFREKLIRDTKDFLEYPSSFNWTLGDSEKASKTLDVLEGKGPLGTNLKSGQAPHRLLFALSCDFYRPQRPVSLYSTLFPSEYFNPTSSLKRVHFTIERLRGWFKKTRFPLLVEELPGSGYVLKASSACTLRVTDVKAIGKEIIRLDVVKKRLGSLGELTRQEFEKSLNLSPRSANRLVGNLVTEGYLEKAGGGRHVKYRWRK